MTPIGKRSSGQAWTASSIRWKSNIETIEKPLEKVSRLRGVYFDWDAEHGGYHDVGMIAEEVGAVLPEIVSYEKNGIDAAGMDYGKMTPLLVEAVKALHTQVNRLQTQIVEKDAMLTALREQNETFSRRLAALEKTVLQNNNEIE